MFVPFNIIRFGFFLFSGLPALKDIYSIKVLHKNSKKTKRFLRNLRFIENKTKEKFWINYI